MVGPHSGTATPHVYEFIFLHFLLHFIPAMIADIVLLATFRKPLAVSIFWKATMNLREMTYFGNGNWKIYVDETQKVWERMNKRDRYLFFCDLRLLDWALYAYPYWAGLRVYLLKDPMSTVAAGRRRYLILQGTFEFVKKLAYICIIYYALSTIIATMSPLIVYVLKNWYGMKC